MLTKLIQLLDRPELDNQRARILYHNLWDDEHVSKGMLKAHLDPHWDAATRNHAFLDESVAWIAKLAPPPQYPKLLDLGCGPGLYARRFANAGYIVTGIDYSKRSIGYAQVQAAQSGSGIEYIYQDYLTIDYTEQFDSIVLIFCDYAVPSRADRHTLLGKVYQALKPGGKFIFDVFTPNKRKKESRTWRYNQSSGFYSGEPHLLLEATYQYDDDDNTELSQSIVITDEDVKRYACPNHYFTKDALSSEIAAAGFEAPSFYADAAGKEYSDSGDTICVVLTK